MLGTLCVDNEVRKINTPGTLGYALTTNLIRIPNLIQMICQHVTSLIQWYSTLEFNHIVNFHIDMTKSGKNMVIPDKLLLDEVNKKQIMNENDTMKTIDLADIECGE